MNQVLIRVGGGAGLSVLTMTATTAMAHSGSLAGGSFAGFEAGIMHPYGGLDHMLLAFGLGLLFSRDMKFGGLWGAVILIAMLIVGFIAGISFEFTSVFIEIGIMASVVITAALLFQSKRFMLLTIAGGLAVFHGIAHGMEIPTNASAIGFMAGMVTAMTILYIVGYGFGQIILQNLPAAFKRHHWIEKALAVIGVSALLLS